MITWNKAFNDISSGFKSFEKKAPRKYGKIAVNFFKMNFSKQGFQNASLERWRPNKRQSSNQILVKTGQLKNSIKLGRTKLDNIEVISDTTYGVYHNEGTDKIPKREFIGNSIELERILTKAIEKDINKIFE